MRKNKYGIAINEMRADEKMNVWAKGIDDAIHSSP